MLKIQCIEVALSIPGLKVETHKLRFGASLPGGGDGCWGLTRILVVYVNIIYYVNLHVL